MIGWLGTNFGNGTQVTVTMSNARVVVYTGRQSAPSRWSSGPSRNITVSFQGGGYHRSQGDSIWTWRRSALGDFGQPDGARRTDPTLSAGGDDVCDRHAGRAGLCPDHPAEPRRAARCADRRLGARRLWSVRLSHLLFLCAAARASPGSKPRHLSLAPADRRVVRPPAGPSRRQGPALVASGRRDAGVRRNNPDPARRVRAAGFWWQRWWVRPGAGGSPDLVELLGCLTHVPGCAKRGGDRQLRCNDDRGHRAA